MRRYLFERAKFLKEKIELLSETDYSIRLKVGDQEVVIKYQNSQLIMLCTCQQYGKSGRICSHVIAGLAYLSNEKNNGLG